MIFLLSTQSLLDLLAGKPEIMQWRSRVAPDQVEISVISIGQALATIRRRVSDLKDRAGSERQLQRIIQAVQLYQGVIAFEFEAVEAWLDLLNRNLVYDVTARSYEEKQLSSESRMVVATALQRGATLVEGPRPYHANIPGLSVVSP